MQLDALLLGLLMGEVADGGVSRIGTSSQLVVPLLLITNFQSGSSSLCNPGTLGSPEACDTAS
ncbi:hypothetical protein PF007_g29918 [Phytophthora fragariae]|uniref:Uncharacterized protein n=1 Tax=Phytophthora fragariae TaxID=53985 RepID=A0A6A3PW99_9STRA|nr:hypothetical protein PF007_g29918 [Phytophthora fragariae]